MLLLIACLGAAVVLVGLGDRLPSPPECVRERPQAPVQPSDTIIILNAPSELPLQMLHEVVIMTMPITRGESEPHTGSGLELDGAARRCC